MHPLDNETAREVFHWRISQAVMPFCVGTGTAMTLTQHYLAANVFFLCFGAWTIGLWLTSEWLSKTRRLLLSRNIRRQPGRLISESRRCFSYEWGGVLFIILCTVSCMIWNRSTRREAEQRDVADHLRVEFFMAPSKEADAVLRSTVTTINGSHIDIPYHELTCVANMISWEDGTHFQNTKFGGWNPPNIPIKAGGDGATEYCQTGLTVSQVIVPTNAERKFKCGDVLVIITYSIVTQPNVFVQKTFRFVSTKDTGFTWKPEPVSDPRLFCPG